MNSTLSQFTTNFLKDKRHEPGSIIKYFPISENNKDVLLSNPLMYTHDNQIKNMKNKEKLKVQDKIFDENLNNLKHMLDEQFLLEYEHNVRIGKKSVLIQLDKANIDKQNEDRLKVINAIAKKNGNNHYLNKTNRRHRGKGVSRKQNL